MLYNNLVYDGYSVLGRTLRGSLPRKVILVREERDVMENQDDIVMPRYEYFRGVEGDIILDFTRYTGVKDLGDRIEVLAGTTWRDVLPYNPEVYCNSDASVGGSVYFNDGCFGDNEFRSLQRRVEVRAVESGKVYTGEYRGGIVMSVLVRKEGKPMITRSYKGNLDKVQRKVLSLFSPISAMRDITLVRDGNDYILYMSYPSTREAVVSKFLQDTEPSEPYLETIGITHDFRVFGRMPMPKALQSLYLLQGVERGVVRFNRENASFSLYAVRSYPQLPPEFNLAPFSDKPSGVPESPCIMCGRCVARCPHSFQRGSDPTFSPMGFYSSESKEEVSNCHLCGICESECPVHLDIVKDLRKFVRPKLRWNSIPKLSYPKSRSLVVTPITLSLGDFVIRVWSWAKESLKDVGLLSLDVDYSAILVGEAPDLGQIPESVKELVLLTPEDRFYLEPYLKKAGFMVTSLEDFIKLPKNGERIHIGCFAKGEGIRTCSTKFLNILNQEGEREVKVDVEVSLCPLASRKLGVKNLMDYVGVDGKAVEEEAKQWISKAMNEGAKMDVVKEYLEWYRGVDESLYLELNKRMTGNTNVPPGVKLYALFMRDNMTPEEIEFIQPYL